MIITCKLNEILLVQTEIQMDLVLNTQHSDAQVVHSRFNHTHHFLMTIPILAWPQVSMTSKALHGTPPSMPMAHVPHYTSLFSFCSPCAIWTLIFKEHVWRHTGVWLGPECVHYYHKPCSHYNQTVLWQLPFRLMCLTPFCDTFTRKNIRRLVG